MFFSTRSYLVRPYFRCDRSSDPEKNTVLQCSSDEYFFRDPSYLFLSLPNVKSVLIIGRIVLRMTESILMILRSATKPSSHKVFHDSNVNTAPTYEFGSNSQRDTPLQKIRQMILNNEIEILYNLKPCSACCNVEDNCRNNERGL